MQKVISAKAGYEAPQTEVLEVRVERGFQASGTPEAEKGTERLTESGNEYTFS